MNILCEIGSFVWVQAALLSAWPIFMGPFFLSFKFEAVAIIMMISYRKWLLANLFYFASPLLKSK